MVKLINLFKKNKIKMKYQKLIIIKITLMFIFIKKKLFLDQKFIKRGVNFYLNTKLFLIKSKNENSSNI